MNCKNLPSLLMPTAMHFLSLQYWHLFLLILRMEHCWFFVQGLYWIFCWMLRRKKPCGQSLFEHSSPDDDSHPELLSSTAELLPRSNPFPTKDSLHGNTAIILSLTLNLMLIGEHTFRTTLILIARLLVYDFNVALTPGRGVKRAVNQMTQFPVVHPPK